MTKSSYSIEKNDVTILHSTKADTTMVFENWANQNTAKKLAGKVFHDPEGSFANGDIVKFVQTSSVNGSEGMRTILNSFTVVSQAQRIADMVQSALEELNYMSGALKKAEADMARRVEKYGIVDALCWGVGDVFSSAGVATTADHVKSLLAGEIAMFTMGAADRKLEVAPVLAKGLVEVMTGVSGHIADDLLEANVSSVGHNLNEQYQAQGKAQARKTMLGLVKRIENVLA
jgi:hypothetical protein